MKPCTIVVLFLVASASLGCEQYTREYRQTHGGSYVFIQPLKDNGAYDTGEYNGHWLNKAYSVTRGVYYFDATYLLYFKNTSEISVWYKNETGKYSQIFDMSEKRTPFPIRMI